MLGVLFAAWAWGQATPEVCGEALGAPAEVVSVAWVSPVGRRVGGRAWLEVVPTGELRRWMSAEDPTIGRLLQRMGQRKTERDPRRRFKVTVFEVRAADLCRPVEGALEAIAGVASCEGGLGRSTATYSGCGYTTDLRDGARGFDVYRVQWRDAAVQGFCVLPGERFVAEGGR
jgi:hypothetical protein